MKNRRIENTKNKGIKRYKKLKVAGEANSMTRNYIKCVLLSLYTYIFNKKKYTRIILLLGPSIIKFHHVPRLSQYRFQLNVFHVSEVLSLKADFQVQQSNAVDSKGI